MAEEKGRRRRGGGEGGEGVERRRRGDWGVQWGRAKNSQNGLWILVDLHRPSYDSPSHSIGEVRSGPPTRYTTTSGCCLLPPTLLCTMSSGPSPPPSFPSLCRLSSILRPCPPPRSLPIPLSLPAFILPASINMPPPIPTFTLPTPPPTPSPPLYPPLPPPLHCPPSSSPITPSGLSVPTATCQAVHQCVL